MILTLVTVGKYLENRSKYKTSDAITKLIELAPQFALNTRQRPAKHMPHSYIK